MYKRISARKRRTIGEFTVTKTKVIEQRNGVTAVRTDAVTLNERGIERDVVIFANGRNADQVLPHLVTGFTVRLEGKFSQHNTFVALCVAAPG